MKKLGFGLMRLPRTNPDDPAAVDKEAAKGMIDAFLAGGGTYFDTAYPYQGGTSERLFGELVAARHPRQSYEITTKMPLYLVEGAADYERIFAEQLANCRVDYFDNYLLHSLSGERYEQVQQADGFGFLARMKAAGKIRRFGFSYHDGAELLDRVLTEHPETELVQLQINYIDWEDKGVQSRRCYEVCVKHGVPVAVMEPLKGGSLTRLPQKAAQFLQDCRPDASLASWGIRFAACLEQVEVVLSGMSDRAQVEDNLSIMESLRPLDPQERDTLRRAVRTIRESIAIPCTACGYCTDGCPKGIAIPEYFAIYNNQKMFGLVPGLRATYENTCQRHGKPEDCIACGQCEAHCPQHLSIIRELQVVKEAFQK